MKSRDAHNDVPRKNVRRFREQRSGRGVARFYIVFVSRGYVNTRCMYAVRENEKSSVVPRPDGVYLLATGRVTRARRSLRRVKRGARRERAGKSRGIFMTRFGGGFPAGPSRRGDFPAIADDSVR